MLAVNTIVSKTENPFIIALVVAVAALSGVLFMLVKKNLDDEDKAKKEVQSSHEKKVVILKDQVAVLSKENKEDRMLNRELLEKQSQTFSEALNKNVIALEENTKKLEEITAPLKCIPEMQKDIEGIRKEVDNLKRGS